MEKCKDCGTDEGRLVWWEGELFCDNCKVRHLKRLIIRNIKHNLKNLDFEDLRKIYLRMPVHDELLHVLMGGHR